MPEFCGCCGRQAKRGDGYNGLWCKPCQRHVLRHGHLEERTYFAQTGKPCPLDVARAIDRFTASFKEARDAE